MVVGPSQGDMMAAYLDRMHFSMNWIGETMENTVQHFNITQPPPLGNQYPYCPSWSKM